jgi:hypothetical protein
MKLAGRTLAALLCIVTADARAQRTQLELRPRVGDTLRMRLDQVMEVSGRRGGSAMIPVVTTLQMFSRAIVESSSPTSVLILAITDSVEVVSSDARSSALLAQTEQALKGRRMRLRLAPDGTVGVADSPAVPKEVNDLVSVMPASFPKEPVGVGETWTREMPIASGSTFGAPVGGVVRASFTLDSVTPGTDLAFVTMRGTVEPPRQVRSFEQSMSGSVEGRIVVNRKRGWLSETRFQVEMNTTVQSLAEPRGPMQLRTKITQHVRIFDRR